MKLAIPKKILDQHLVVLGKTGAGKSSVLRHIVEHLLREGKRVCIVDPKGDWWGLKASADGKGPGFPVVTFGDFKEENVGDVPINSKSGKHVAELVTSGNRPCVIGLRGWYTSHMLEFWIEFAKEIFHANSGELYLVVDECHNVAPKQWKNLDAENNQASRALHWSNRILAEGRGLGVVCLLASQRSQKVHNDTLTSCDTLVAMRVTHPADRKAVQDWIKGAGDEKKGQIILDAIGSMKRGEAWVWSAEIGFGPTKVEFPLFETFDSFAPPQLQKKVSRGSWADVDLDEVKEKLSAVIEEAKANDPKELRSEIARLRHELRKKEGYVAQTAQPEVKVERVEIPVLQPKEVEKLEKFGMSLTSINEVAQSLLSSVRNFRAPLPKPSAMRGIFKTQQRVAESGLAVGTGAKNKATDAGSNPAPLNHNGDAPSGGLKRIMVALAQRSGLSAKQVGVRAGLSSSSGTFGTYLGRLRSNGWVAGDRNSMQLTDAGIEALGHYDPLPEGRALYEHWRSELGNGGASRILQVLFEAHPQPLTKEEVGERANISHTSGTFGTYLGKLRTLELISGSRELKASDEFFQ